MSAVMAELVEVCCDGLAGNFVSKFAGQRTRDWHAATGSFEWSLMI